MRLIAELSFEFARWQTVRLALSGSNRRQAVVVVARRGRSNRSDDSRLAREGEKGKDRATLAVV